MNITDTLNDLQNVLMQQNSIYETNQNLHFDWLQSVIFQLNVYDQSNKGDIKVNESKSIIDLEQISYNYNMQQQTVLNNCKEQILHLNMKNNDQKKNEKLNENSSQNKAQKEQSPPKSKPKVVARPRNRRKNALQKKAASMTFIKSPISPSKQNNTNKERKIKKRSNEKPNTVSCSAKKNKVTSPSQLVKFVDNDSLLSVSQSSDSCNEEIYYENDDQFRLCQSLPSKETPLSISCNITELAQSVSSFQEKWQEMVEEKKRTSLLPRPPIGSLFNFDDAPESYQITDSENGDDFFFSDEDDEIHEEDPLEIHGKMIPSWARKEKVEEQLIEQQKNDPDNIFTEMPKHCVLSQIFDNFENVGPSILAQGYIEDNDNYEELMSI